MNFKMIPLKNTDIKLIDGDRGDNYPSDKDFFECGDCLFLEASNITTDGFDFSNTHFITKEKDASLRNGKLKRNDIVMMTRGSVGHVAIYDNSVPYENIRINSGMIILRCNNEFSSKELYFLLKSNFISEQIKHLMSGSVQKQLPASIINEIKLIHLNEKSVSILQMIDGQIQRNKDMVHKLQVLGNTIYSKIMCQPKTKVLLGDIATMYQPETITSDQFVDNGQYPVYGAGGIIGFYDRCNHKDIELMLSCRGVCGKTEISLPNSFIIGNQMVIKTKDEEMKYFLYNYLSNSDLSKIETGSVQKQITRTNLEKMPIMLPPTEIINQHSHILKNIYNMKIKIILENTKYNALKTKLLPLLINGQLST